MATKTENSTSMETLRKLNKASASTLLSNIKTFFFDCDGVLWNSFGAIDGAAELVNKLREQEKTLFFVTNNSSASRKDCLKKFEKFGINVEAPEILPTSYLAARFVKKILKLKKVYMIGSQGMVDEFNEEGVEYIGFGPQLPKANNDGHYALSYDTDTDPKVEAVVVGFDTYFNLNKIAQAMQYLKNTNMPFIATNTDSSFPVGNGTFTPGTGCIVEAVRTAVGREPTVLGKPNKLLYDIAKTITHIVPEETLMIGDRLDTDILFGKNCGFQTLCVLTGVTQPRDLMHVKNCQSHDFPDFITDSVKDLSTAL